MNYHAKTLLALLVLVGSASAADQPVYRHLKIYQPAVKTPDIYFPHPGKRPFLKYNHDADIIKFKGRFLCGWNANENTGEDVPDSLLMVMYVKPDWPMGMQRSVEVRLDLDSITVQ